MENYPDSFTFQSFSALNLEMLWFHKRAVHVGFTSRRNSPASGGAKTDLLNAQCPCKTATSQPAELMPGYWYWLRISSASSTLLFWLASQFFNATFEPCDATAAAPPRSRPRLSCWRYGCVSRRANSAEAAFSWTKLMEHDSSVPLFSPQGNHSVVAWIWQKSQCQVISSKVLDRRIS